MRYRPLLLLTLISLFPALDVATEAEARRRAPAIIGFGEKITDIGELPAESKALARQMYETDMKVD